MKPKIPNTKSVHKHLNVNSILRHSKSSSKCFNKSVNWQFLNGRVTNDYFSIILWIILIDPAIYELVALTFLGHNRAELYNTMLCTSCCFKRSWKILLLAIYVLMAVHAVTAAFTSFP